MPPRIAGPMYPHRVAALDEVLHRCNRPDSVATLWSYTVAHGQLALKINGPDGVRAVLWLDACERIETPSRWTPVNLRFDEVSTESQPRYLLVDAAAAFMVRCGLILVGDEGGSFPEPDPAD